MGRTQGHKTREKRHNRKRWVMVWLYPNYYIKNKMYPFLRLKGWVRGKQNICGKSVSCISDWLPFFGSRLELLFPQSDSNWVMSTHGRSTWENCPQSHARDHAIGKFVITENFCFISYVHRIVVKYRVSWFKGTLKSLQFDHSQSKLKSSSDEHSLL